MKTLPTIKLTKKLQAFLDRYGIEVPDDNQAVRHVMYGTETEVSGIVFAVFRLAVTTQYLCWMLWNPDDVAECQHFERIAESNGFALPEITDEMLLDRSSEIKRHDAAYQHSRSLIADSSLYHKFLD